MSDPRNARLSQRHAPRRSGRPKVRHRLSQTGNRQAEHRAPQLRFIHMRIREPAKSPLELKIAIDNIKTEEPGPKDHGGVTQSHDLGPRDRPRDSRRLALPTNLTPSDPSDGTVTP